MKNFLKENWFKLSFASAVILIGVSFFYYYVIFLPQKEQQAQRDKVLKEEQAQLEKEAKELDDKIADCQKLGYALFEKDKNEVEKINVIITNPEFHYNKPLNTCFYKATKDAVDVYYSEYIKNVYSNETIAAYTFFNSTKSESDTEAENASRNDFWNRYNELYEKRYP